MSRTSAFTRTDQNFLSFARSNLWSFIPGLAGLSWRSKAVVLTAFCSSPVRRARLSVNVSAMRKAMSVTWQHKQLRDGGHLLVRGEGAVGPADVQMDALDQPD